MDFSVTFAPKPTNIKKKLGFIMLDLIKVIFFLSVVKFVDT